jgi:xylan 1,4-beta-xylosidase
MGESFSIFVHIMNQIRIISFLFIILASNPAARSGEIPNKTKQTVVRQSQRQVFPQWARGFEGQRKADLGSGLYLNPIIAGDHPDPSILKDGDDYYMTFSSFDSYPGLVIWHSKDLVNWTPITPTLFKNVGSVWAPELIKYKGRLYIYFPGRAGSYRSNYVITADNIKGPWSDPVDLKIPLIDPGHAVGEDGKRYLFLSGGSYVQLSEDGRSTVGEIKKVYDGWKYPDEWIVESYSQEGPKVTRIGDYYYMILAEGGTAGPPTGHMIVCARSRSIHGPWENSPYNPVARTTSPNEYWWSKGHGTLVQSPNGAWYMVYHAYEKNFLTLGRQTMLEPVVWTADGWPKFTGIDPSQPIRKPVRSKQAVHGFPFSDDFSTNKIGMQWSFYNGNIQDSARYRYETGALYLKGKGNSPSNSSPLWFVNGDLSYQIEIEFELTGDVTAGLLVFYNNRSYAGLAFSDTSMILHRYGLDRILSKPDMIKRKGWIRLINDHHLVSLYYSNNGQNWKRHDIRMDVSGYHHNTFYDFLSLRPAIYASGSGEVRFDNFKYQALP